MDITEELEPDDMMVHQTTQPSILMSDSGGGGGGLVRGAGVGPASGELGRRLLAAARHGDTQLVLALLGKGAPFTTDWLGTSALHAAAAGAHADTCAVLLRAGVSRDTRTKVERTPLHLAAHAGHARVAALLLQHRAAVDCRDMLRMTPLHWAAERGHAPVAALLLRHGAAPHALSKFNKTPHSIAAERNRKDIIKLIEDALEEREAAKSVESLRVANENEDPDQQQSIDPLDRLQEAARHTIKRAPQPEQIKINIERPLDGPGQAAAAAMLRRHGIALLPRDEGSTVLTALQSGRSVVLSDAGKLMLKESSEVPHVVKSTPAPAPTPVSKGVVLTATPVKSPPRQGVKIFTLNNKLLAMPKENKAPVKKIINPHDSMQIQYIKLSSDSKSTVTKIPMKAKNKLPVARPTVKLMMPKANFSRLLATTDSAIEVPVTGAESKASKAQVQVQVRGGGDVVVVPEQFLSSTSCGYLRAQLVAAHRTIADLQAQLAACQPASPSASPSTSTSTSTSPARKCAG